MTPAAGNDGGWVGRSEKLTPHARDPAGGRLGALPARVTRRAHPGRVGGTARLRGGRFPHRSRTRRRRGRSRRVAATAGAFFDLPGEEKRRLAGAADRPGAPVYRPLGAERLRATLGGPAASDLKESLDFGPSLPGVAWPERSTLHRVVNPPAERRAESRRQSLVFFHKPRADAVIEPVAGTGDTEYEPVVAGDYVLAKANEAFGLSTAA